MSTELVDLLLTPIGGHLVALRAEDVQLVAGQSSADPDVVDLAALMNAAPAAGARLLYAGRTHVPIRVGPEVSLRRVDAASVVDVPQFVDAVARRSAIAKVAVLSDDEIAFVIDPFELGEKP